MPELIQALLDPKSYPHSPPWVKLVQTQMSFVFLAGDLDVIRQNMVKNFGQTEKNIGATVSVEQK